MDDCSPLLRTVHQLLSGTQSTKSVTDILLAHDSIVRILTSGFSPTSKLIVSRLLPLQEPAPWDPLLMWLSGPPDAKAAEIRRSITELRRLRILLLVQSSPSATTTPPGGSQISGSRLTMGTNRSQTATSRVKYRLDPTYRATVISLTTASQRPLKAHVHPTLRLAMPQELRLIPLPDTFALRVFAQRQWVAILTWIFKQTVDYAPNGGLRMFQGLAEAQPPGPQVLQALEARGLSKERSLEGTMQRMGNTKRPMIGKVALSWFLADLSEQMTSLIFNYIQKVTSAPRQDDTFDHNHVRAVLYCLLGDMGNAKIGQPLILERPKQYESLKEIDSLLTLCHELGLIIASGFRISGQAYRYVIPTELSRIFILDGNTSTDIWLLSQLYSADNLNSATGDKGVSAAVKGALPLPRQRYGQAILEKSERLFKYNQNVSRGHFEWNSPADALQSFPRGDFARGVIPKPLAATSESVALSKGIVVESNFRVFAYRPDALQASVLFNLVDVKLSTPVMLVGMLTRESVSQAFSSGLSAKQIISFFASHAHKSVKKRLQEKTKSFRTDTTAFGNESELPVSKISGARRLPENVVNQLDLWEAQRSTIKMHKGTLFEFTDEAELDLFPHLVARARLSGALLCHTPLPANSAVGSAEFQKWKNDVLKRMKMSQVSRPRTTTFSDRQNWFAANSLIVVKSEFKEEFIRQMKLARVNQSASKQRAR